MAVLNKEAFMKRLQEHLGDDTSDTAMSFLEDMTDTFNDMEAHTLSSNDESVQKLADLQKKYDELDGSWRKRYRDRFFSGSKEDDREDDPGDDHEDDTSEKTFDDLFTERED